MKILIIKLFEDKLYEYEFIRPITDIIKNNFKIMSYKKINSKEIEKYDKIIIAGTLLKEFDYLNQINKFNWIKKTKKSILGICSGAQLITQIYDGKIINYEEIGLNKIEIVKKDKIIKNLFSTEVYSLHQKAFEISNDFEIIAKTKIPQIVKHKNKNIYAILFHPEVRNKEIIENFISFK